MESPPGDFSRALTKSFHYADVAFLMLNKAWLNLDPGGIIFGGIAIKGN